LVVQTQLIVQSAHNRIVLTVVEPRAVRCLHIRPEAHRRLGVQATRRHTVTRPNRLIRHTPIDQIIVPQLLIMRRQAVHRIVRVISRLSPCLLLLYLIHQIESWSFAGIAARRRLGSWLTLEALLLPLLFDLLLERGVGGEVDRLEDEACRLIDDIEVAGAVGHARLDVQAVRGQL